MLRKSENYISGNRKDFKQREKEGAGMGEMARGRSTDLDKLLLKFWKS